MDWKNLFVKRMSCGLAMIAEGLFVFIEDFAFIVKENKIKIPLRKWKSF
jgi:hypothetical protein